VNPNGPETSPPGDIPDNQAFVPYSPPGGGYTVEVPEGWARTQDGSATVFTDKLNSIRMESHKGSCPTVATVKAKQPGKVSKVARKGGTAVLVTYTARSKPDPVTGKVRTLAIERYAFCKGGKEVDLTLSGAKGADNVDPWKIVTDSLRFTA
jgi:hypothetical protein